MTQVTQQLINRNQRFKRRKARTKANIVSLDSRPRLAIFRSARYVSAQIIDDVNNVTLVAATEHELSDADKKKTKTERAQLVGTAIAKKAVEKKITKVAFDRSGYLYHGRVKALADSAREAGLEF